MITKKMPIRCGIVGTGAFARRHAQVIASIPDIATIVAAHDTNQIHGQAFVKEWGGTYDNDLPTLVKRNLDLIVVVTPDNTHVTVLQQLLGTHHVPKLIIVEKPLCTTPEELAIIKTLLPQCQTRIIVDHSRRFNTGVLRMRDLLRSGELGQLLSVHWTYYAGWFHTGVHAVDTLRMLLGECRCTAATMNGTDRFHDDPLLSVTLTSQEFPSVPITFVGLPEHPYQLFEAEFICSAGRMRMQWNDVFVDRLQKGTYGPMLWFSEHFTVDPIEKALTTLYSSCYAAQHGEKTPLLDGTDFAAACGTMEILFAALAKARP